MNVTNELQWRDLHLLHVHRDTLRCALTRCVACCYKIVLHNRPGLMPNVRPEMCPRMASKVKADDEQDAKADGHSIGLYDAAQVKRILTVGDGNFSYSLALARALGPDSGVQLVTTSHESKKSVVETYPDGEKILEELNAMSNVTVQHEIDATDAKQMKTLGQFDRVIWNFPCVRAPRGEDGQNEEMEINKKLLNDFFAHVAQILTPTGEVHVTHKTKKPFGQWGIESIAKVNTLRHHQSVVFDRCLYPGYSNKKVLSKGSFPIWDSLTFIFVPEDRVQAEVDAVNSEDAEENTPIEPVTMDILKKMYLLLAPSLDDMLGSKKKKKKGFRGLNSSQKDVSISLKGSKEKSGDKSNNIHKGNSKRKQPASGNLKVGKRKKAADFNDDVLYLRCLLHE